VRIGVIGAPVDLGADRRGVDMGASAIRYAGLVVALQDDGHSVRDFGNIAAPVMESLPEPQTRLKHLSSIAAMAELLHERVLDVIQQGYAPLILGGDHSISLGSIAAVSFKQKTGVIWFDAHGDFNTAETSPSGNIHGMVLAALCGYGDRALLDVAGGSPKVDPHNVALVGVRDLDDGERVLLQESGAQIFTMHDVDSIGLPTVMERAIACASLGTDGIHMSLDLDVVDPHEAPGVGTPVLGGLTYRETHLGMEMLAESKLMISMDIVEVNPVLDTHNSTAHLSVEFARSAFGKRIL
jgi:arginase